MHKTSSSSIVATMVKDCLIVTVGDDLSGGVLEEVRRVVLRDVHQKGCLSIIFELSALKFMDTLEFDGLKTISEMASILGARAMFVGMQPGIVFHLIANDAHTVGVSAALDLNEALEKLGITNAASRN
ncbi:MAG: STAS domain-containing protein [Polynucleobacter sp.]